MANLSLPIDEILPEISAELSTQNRLVLAAPPGAGKTTRVPLHLLEEKWLGEGRIILIEPRRLAARRAAERMAATLGQPVGQIVGLRSRLDTRVSTSTRIEVVTDGVFSNQVIRDPDLPGVAAVIFDEFHERGLEADLGLTLALETQNVLRDDLRLIIMSATLDVETVCSFLKCRAVESQGRAFPVETRYLGRSQDRLEDQMAKAIRKAISDADGSVLAFLPGAAEIRRTAERLTTLGPNFDICPLYGALPPKEQDDAIAPAKPGRRKIVLSTDIAESSLTIEGVRIVVDAGLARVPVFNPGMVSGRLDTRRASLANVDQRRGRAGRTEPGICYRLWHEEENRGLAKAPTPEISSTDLSNLLLRLMDWGEADPLQLNWLTPPSAGGLEAARSELEALGLVTSDKKLTNEGRAAANLPLSPRLARLITSANSDAEKRLAAELAVLLSEKGRPGQTDDLAQALSGFRTRDLARNTGYKNLVSRLSGSVKAQASQLTGEWLARAWPDRLAMTREAGSSYFLSVGGSGFRLPDGSRHAGQTWLVVADASGSAGSDQTIRLACDIDSATVRKLFPTQTVTTAEFDPEAISIRARARQMIGSIQLSERPLQKPDNDVIAKAVIAHIESSGFEQLPGHAWLRRLLARYTLCRDHFEGLEWPEVSEASLIKSVEDWLSPQLEQSGLAALKPETFLNAVRTQFDWSALSRIDAEAPSHCSLPSGRRVEIDYLGEQAPMISARVQEFYSCQQHPSILSGRLPLTVSLLSPAQRPVAVTKDLPGFWKGGYLDMKKDMKGRYPKHDWPDDPATATPLQPGARRRN